MTRVSRSLKIEHVALSTLSKLIFHIFSRNESRSVELSSLFATHRRSAEITRKKKSEDHTENVKIKELFELSDRFYEEFAKSTFYRCTET